MILGTMTRPLLVCLGEIPQAVLSGLFFIMGINGLMTNVIIHRIVFLFSDPKRRDNNSPLAKISKRSMVIFLCFSLAGFTGEFAITNTIAAIGFPLVLLLSVIVSFSFTYIFPSEELKVLDNNVAQRFTLKNLLLENIRDAKFSDRHKF